MKTKIAYADTVSYEMPSSLGSLVGPAAGIVDLPRSLYWGPERNVDLANHDDVQRMYQAVVCIGTVAEQERWLNQQVLREIWPDLVLPVRCKDAWTLRFPELGGATWVSLTRSWQ